MEDMEEIVCSEEEDIKSGLEDFLTSLVERKHSPLTALQSLFSIIIHSPLALTLSPNSYSPPAVKALAFRSSRHRRYAHFLASSEGRFRVVGRVAVSALVVKPGPILVVKLGPILVVVGS
ncbi:hypothetical protein Ahy_A06g029416 isoform A [Arachis hypogaea]|uniref:Uncharacterized protein n=1 Tax=Arachis hypogaea TaxID=3818 RepID=A0A445CTC4_ARAHY|nr:hypothetical protein Ahy_A06g029416 isoform A [Arachis hypogaea]